MFCLSVFRVLWQRLEERLEWKHGRTNIPKGSKRLMCLVDDLNLAYVSYLSFCLSDVLSVCLSRVVAAS